LIELGGSFAWCSTERSYHHKPYKPDWGLVKQAPYDNTTYSYHSYQASNWINKPLEDRLKLLVAAHKGQSMMGIYRPAPYAPYPTAENYKERVTKRIFDNITGAGQKFGIFYSDYLGNRYYN
jgi:hypothetical protein|tara:strand:+ start:300 stop:665 length:366 start_codon:yes stop_codon:yes gene_type:complete